MNRTVINLLSLISHQSTVKPERKHPIVNIFPFICYNYNVCTMKSKQCFQELDNVINLYDSKLYNIGK